MRPHGGPLRMGSSMHTGGMMSPWCSNALRSLLECHNGWTGMRAPTLCSPPMGMHSIQVAKLVPHGCHAGRLDAADQRRVLRRGRDRRGAGGGWRGRACGLQGRRHRAALRVRAGVRAGQGRAGRAGMGWGACGVVRAGLISSSAHPLVTLGGWMDGASILAPAVGSGCWQQPCQQCQAQGLSRAARAALHACMQAHGHH